MSRRSADDIFNSEKNDESRLVLTIELMATTDPTLDIFRTLKRENHILFLKFAKQDIFNEYLTKYGSDCIEMLSQEKLNIWLKNFKVDILGSTSYQIDMYEKLVRYEYIDAQPILFMIVNCDKIIKEKNPTYVESIHKLLETCLYSMGEFNGTWADFENLSPESMKIVAHFFVNRERLNNAQKQTQSAELTSTKTKVQKQPTKHLKTDFKYQSQTNKMLFMINAMKRNRMTIFCMLALSLFVYVYDAQIAGTCTIAETSIKKFGNEYRRTTHYRPINIGHVFDRIVQNDNCHLGQHGAIECDTVPKISDCHIRHERTYTCDEDDDDDYECRAHSIQYNRVITLGANNFTKMVRHLFYVNYCLGLFIIINTLYWSYYENDLLEEIK
jgi:hypothetical protein